MSLPFISLKQRIRLCHFENEEFFRFDDVEFMWIAYLDVYKKAFHSWSAESLASLEVI